MTSPKVRARPTRLAARDTRTAPAARAVEPLYTSKPWRTLIWQRGRRCQVRGCGRSHDEDGKPIRIFGDHIVELRDDGAPLDPKNVMLMCGSCHTTKTIAVRAARMAETF